MSDTCNTPNFWSDLGMMCLEHTIGAVVTFLVFCALLLVFPQFRQVLFSRMRRLQR